MNEEQFIQQWEKDKPVYRAWGDFIVESLSGALINEGKGTDGFLKIPAKYRLKDDQSLIDKAFYRGKNYANPYVDIEDKVGVRFVVLLLDDISLICRLIEAYPEWDYDPCKHFDEDRRRDPLLFTYQSVHYILRPKRELVFNDLVIPKDTPCEVQVRTLLQHAHAELTHDAVYKAKRVVQPEVHRTVAKSMALIETTDQFFSEVSQKLNFGPIQEYKVIERLGSIYSSFTGCAAHEQKSSMVIWDVFESLIDDGFIDKVATITGKYPFLAGLIRQRYHENSFFQQGTILFLYWMLANKKKRLLADWPLSGDVLDVLAGDIGVNIHDD